MTDFILGVFEITIGMSLFIALLLIGLKLFGGKFTAKCRYIIWALVMIRLAIPFSFGLLPTLIEIPIDTELVQSEDLSSVLSENTDSVTSVQPSDPGDVVVTPTTPSTPVFPNVDTANPGSTPILPVTPTVPGDQAESVIPSDPVIETPTEQPVSLRQIFDIAGIVYLTGAAIFLVWSLVSYFIYTRKILRSVKAADKRTQQIFSTICKNYGIKKQPTLLVASGIHSPAAFGIFRRKIVLPDIAFTENGLVGTLAHEVTHCKRGDLYMKLVELIACSLNWFNPLVHIAAFQCEMEMELSCDEKVLSGSSEAARAAYADVMLDIIRRCRRNRGALTTHFNPKKSAVTARFKNILYGSGKRRGRILIGVCLVLCILAGAFVACQTGDDLTDDTVEDSKVGIVTENLADFLTEEQIAIYKNAGVIYPLFNGNSYSINILHLILEGASFEEQENYIVAHNTGSEGIYKIDQVSYLPSYGEYDNFDEFRALCTSVFTEEYFEELNQGSKYASFIDHNGKLYNIDAAKGGQFGYAPDEFPDEYEVVEMSDEVIVFNVTGHYKSSNVDPDFTLTEETFTVKMVLTENGWRFSKFAYAGLDEPSSANNPDDSIPNEALEYTKKLAKYFRDPVDSVSELREHQNLWQFLVNSIYELHENEIVTLPEVTEKDYYLQYCIPYSYMHKAAELLLGIENGLPEKLMSKDYHWNKDIDAFLYSPFSPPMYVTDCIRSEISEDGIYHITVKISRVEEDEALAVNTYSFKLVEDEEFGKLYQLLAIKKEEMEQIPVEPDPFNPAAYAALIPNSSADRLSWHRIAGTDDYLYFCAIRRINSTMTSYTDDPPKDFAIYHINSSKMDALGYIEAKIPADIVYDTVCPVVAMDGSGSEKCEFVLQFTKDDETFYVSFANYDNIAEGNPLKFDFVGILGDDRVNELKAQYPDAFRKAEKFYWNFTLADFKNENPGNSFVYEGYTVEYECESPYGGKFDFHIHLPQLNSNALYAEKWNYIYQEYEVEFGDLLRKTVHGTNTDHYLNITYNTVTTGDVLTIYIIKSHGILASGAYTRDYDIFHYNMKTDRILSTNEFLAYYAEGQFADYTVTKIVEFMNQIHINADEMGNPLPLTEEDIIGVIPSVFGDSKFDVVYHGYSMEGYDAIRLLFSAYPTYNHQYTYRLTYHDYLNCDEWKMYGQPAGYRLLLCQRVAGEFDAGYYVDCIFTEDIAEPPESYSLSEHGGYYTPVGEDPYGNMCIFIDHETAVGHLNTVIPFDMPTTAQDYYRGVHQGYFSYDRVLSGSNYTVNENIVLQAAEVLDAYRNGKDPNELLPASKTEYTSYPLNTIRENPTANEIGEILKNTSMSEDGTIHFDLDLGDGWVMSLPIRIGGFGESVQAYFTGVWFAHGTPKEEEDIEWTQYSEIDEQTGNEVSFVIPESWNHNKDEVLYDENGNKRIDAFSFPTGYPFESFKDDLQKIANGKLHNLDYAIIGTNNAKIGYIGYHVSVNPIGESGPSNYYFCLNYDDDARFYINIYGENVDNYHTFYDEYVLPIIQSVTIREASTEAIFTSILENKQSFYDGSSKESMLLSEYKAKTDYSVKKYTILDLNDDRDPEMVLWLGYGTNDYVGYLVLHRYENAVYAHEFPYRGFTGLKADGVYTSSSSAFNVSICKLDFDGDTCMETVLARREGDGTLASITYHIADRSVTKAEFDAYEAAQSAKPDAVWVEIESFGTPTITDIADWEKLPWSESWERWGSKPASNAYNFIYNLVSGESEIPEYNGLGITEYSISVVEDEGSGIGTTLSFTFKVAGLSLPSTLIPAIYTWTLYDGMGLFVYHEDKPTNQEEYTAYENRMRGLHRFEGNSAVEAVDTYLSWMPYIYEVSPYGEWDMTDPHIPYNYICAFYGKNLEISFSELQNLMAEKFGIAVERPEKSGLLSRCEYDKERDTVHYADTRGYTAVHRFSDVREEDGITYVSVMLFADKHYLIPSHTIQYKIGEGNVFLGCEIIREGNYDPRELS